jgi:hypothetical protein
MLLAADSKMCPQSQRTALTDTLAAQPGQGFWKMLNEMLMTRL